jgi:hypothetical protein
MNPCMSPLPAGDARLLTLQGMQPFATHQKLSEKAWSPVGQGLMTNCSMCQPTALHVTALPTEQLQSTSWDSSCGNPCTAKNS